MGKEARLRLAPAALLLLGAGGCSAPERVPASAAPVEAGAAPMGFEGDAHGFPALRNLKGETLADGEFTQWLEGDRLHQRIRYDFDAEHWIEEDSVIRQEPALVQESWSWVEVRGGEVERRFTVDFLSGNATAEKRAGGEMLRWSEELDLRPGGAFAGAAWALALRDARERLVAGEVLELQTVGFTPKPRAATVELSYVGLDRLALSGRTLSGDRFRIHPKVPWIARAFVDAPDSHIWLAHPPPAAFLRWEGPLAEPSDHMVRVDLLPGEPSEDAVPARP